jgi:16S rRNA (guanine527-N7)-methyltransferase
MLGSEAVSRETEDQLRRFEGLVRKWNPAINLVSKASLDDLWSRHILDSAQLYTLAKPQGHWLDLGSGGGFPGLVIAILAQGAGDDLRLTLVESDQRKATFLREVTRELSLPVTVRTDRIEHCPPQSADTLSARALAPLTTLLGYATRHLAPNGTAVFPKGASWQQEVEAARKDWHFDLHISPSATDPDGAVLTVKAISHV